ncbi:hypothetical protein XELAEV_18003482mg [Xenopus laevis]|uniref:Uncharacterized protein n=1 Tax=Xenopus laevis TaxID=8355 RepID=A0A974BPQ6_XENLA|nr:hypothetical protein XELAEV_18003482mg [Xenopus laevis]
MYRFIIWEKPSQHLNICEPDLIMKHQHQSHLKFYGYYYLRYLDQWKQNILFVLVKKTKHNMTPKDGGG